MALLGTLSDKKMRAVTDPLAALLVALPVLWALDPFNLMRRWLLLDQLILLELGVAMLLAYWGGGRSKEIAAARPLDLLLGLSSLLACLWTAVRFEAFGFSVSGLGLEPILLSFIILLLTLECSRRTTGVPMTLLILVFVVYGYAAQYVPGALSAPSVKLTSYAAYLAIGGDALIGQSLSILSTVVVIFLLFGRMFEFAGGSEFIRDLTLHFTSASRGAPVKVAVLASGMLGSIVGSTTSNILTVGSFTIPMMRKIGLPAHKAAAVEAVASTGGQLTPPVMGAAAFLMADIAGLPYSEVMVAAIVPSFLYYFSLFVQADRMAARHGFGSAAPGDGRPTSYFLAHGAIYILPVIVIVACLARYEYAPNWAGLMGAFAVAAIGFLRSGSLRGGLAGLVAAVVAAGKSAAALVVMGAAIGIMLGVINSTGLGVSFAVLITEAAAYNLMMALLIAAAAAYVLGTGLATTAVYVLAGTLIAPSLVNLGVSTMGAHLFVFYAAMLSMITPPIAIACLVACGLAGATFMKTSLSAMQFGWIKFVLPFLFVYSPELLLDGEPADIAGILVASMAGIVLVASATAGYERERISVAYRLIYLVAAILLLLPLMPLPLRVLLSVAAILWINRLRVRQASELLMRSRRAYDGAAQ